MSSPAIRITNLTKSYGSKLALEDLNLEVKKGSVVGYIGPNGAGKTTTIRLLLGLIKPSAGRCEIAGHDISTQRARALTFVGYVPGDTNLWPNLTGLETLHLLGKVHGEVDIGYRDSLIKKFDLEPKMKVRAYSKGNRQKVALIGALMLRPDILVLDEPTSGLDPLMEQEFRSCIREAKKRGQTVFLSSHILSEVEALCDDIAIVREGKLIETGSLERMRKLSLKHIEVSFKGEAPDLSSIAGTSNLVVDNNFAKFDIGHDMMPLLKFLSHCEVENLVSREMSLEELFINHYQ